MTTLPTEIVAVEGTSSARRREPVAALNHDVRTALTTVRGFAELMLQRDFAPAKRQQFLTLILAESMRLTELLERALAEERRHTTEAGENAGDLP